MNYYCLLIVINALYIVGGFIKLIDNSAWLNNIVVACAILALLLVGLVVYAIATTIHERSYNTRRYLHRGTRAS